MPHSTSEQTTRIEADRRPMSSADPVEQKKSDGGVTTGGFTLFPETRRSQIRSPDLFDEPSPVDSRDPAQIEAALEALNKPRIDYVTTTHGTPGERKDNNGRIMSHEEGRRLTQYFEDNFSYKDGHLRSARERVVRDSPVIAELRTNVIVKDEFTLVTDMSYHLSTRYSRPESSIMINVDHSACLLHAGSFEPAYILTISAIPAQVQPTINKRNAALIQSFMADVLSVSPERGVLRFVSIPEENLASNGNTICGEIERMEKQQAEDNGLGNKRSLTRGSRKSVNGQKRLTYTRLEPINVAEDNDSKISLVSPPLPTMLSSVPAKIYELSAEEKRQSMQALLQAEKKPSHGILRDGVSSPQRLNSNRKSQSYSAIPKPPPIPMDTQQAQKIGKRKSFMAVFKRS